MRLGRIIDTFNCYFLIALSILYYAQEALFPSGSMIGPAILFVMLTISSGYLLKMLLSPKKFTAFIRIWLLFLIMYVIYYIQYEKLEDFSIIKAVFLNFLPFFPFYYFAEQKILTRKLLIASFLLFLPIFITKFNQSLAELRFQSDTEDVVDNSIYYFIGLLPFPFLFKRKVISFLFLMLIWYFMIQSAKRAAILSGASALILIVFDYLYSSKSKYKIVQYTFTIALLIGVAYFGYTLYEQNQYLIERMQSMMEGYSSGRDNLIEVLFNLWYQSNDLFRYLFGFGYNASRLHSIHVSHNDWMDMLVSFGLLGLLVYMALFRSLILYLFRKDWVMNKKMILALVIAIALIVSMTSRWYWSNFAFMQFLILPYLLATGTEEM